MSLLCAMTIRAEQDWHIPIAPNKAAKIISDDLLIINKEK